MAATDDAESKLQCLWNKYLSSEIDFNEKKTWLDYFSAHVLLEYQSNKNIIDKLEYDVPDIIAREFISEVHQACSESNGADELAPLRKYLLCERGWRCLCILQLFRNSKIRAAYELSNLLMSLYAVVEYEDCLGCEKTNNYLLDNERKNIDDVVQDKLNTIKRKTKNFLHNSSQKKNFNFSKYEKRLALQHEIEYNLSTRPKSLDSDSLDQDVTYLPKILRSPLENHHHSSNFLFGKHNADISSSNESVFAAKSEDSIKLETFHTDAVRQLLEKRINCLEFRSLILSLLQRLCEGDDLNVDEYEEIIGSVIKFTLENLCVVQYRFYKQDYNSIEILRSQLAYLLIICANGTKKCKKVIDSLSQNGVVQIFLQLLQEVSNSVNKCEDSVAVQRNLDFLYSLLYSIVNLFFQILRQENITKNLCTFNKLYRQFIGCSSGRLIENIIKTFLHRRPYVDRAICVKRIKIIVTFFGLLIVRFKKLRRKVNRFEERRNSRCDGQESSFDAGMYNHHDNLFGKAYKALILSPAALHENCCITSTFVVLLKIVLEDADEELTVSVLRILIYCGCCCCVPVHWFLPKLLKSLANRKPATRNLVLLFFERKFYSDIGMCECEDCPLCAVADKKTTDRWASLDEYKALLMSKDLETVRVVGAHLLKIFANFHADVQHYFICHVIGPLFQFAEVEYSSNANYKDSILVCLSLFGDANVYKSFTSEIDNLLQTKDVRGLLADANFTDLCSRILETRIMCKLSNLENTPESFTPVLLNSCTNELTVLMKSFDDYYDEVMETLDPQSDQPPRQDYKQTLHKLKSITCTLERLIVRSTVIKLYFRFGSAKEKFQNLLFVILKILSCDQGTSEQDITVDDVRLKLTQPLLVICLCLFEDTRVIEIKVKELLNEALKVGKISIKQVCDSLLSLERMETVQKEEGNNCATIASNIFGSEANYENDGYEADDEVISWSNVEGAFSETSEEDGDGLVSLLDNCSKSSLLYPTICNIAVDLINALKIDQCTEQTLYCLHHITAVCKKNADICVELTKHGVASKLLDKLQESLAEELLTPEETDVQYAITQFLAVLFYYRVERDELAKFFDFLRINRAPFDHLLTALLSVVNKTSSEAQPSYYLNFPVPPVERVLESDDPAEALVLSMRNIQKNASVASPWVVCGLTLPLNTHLDWCIWLTGFSTSFWIKYTPASGEVRKPADRGEDSKYRTYRKEHEEDGNNEDMVHILSVGYDTLLLETWVDESTCCFVVRLARPEHNSFEILSQATFQKPLDDGNWHHVVLNVKDTMKQQKIALEISLTIDGLYEETRYLIFLGIFMRKVKPACIMVGETRMSLKSRYSIGNFMMFRAAILSKECCLTIRAYGPDTENVVTCASNSSKPNFVDLLCCANYTIPSDFSVSRLIQQYDENMKQMQDNVLITFSPRNAQHFYYYTQNDTSNTVSVSMFPPATPALFKKTKYNFRMNQRVSRQMDTVLLGAIVTERRKTFSACIEEMGGFPFLAFLFAKLVQSTQLEGTQCDGLKLVLKSSFSDIRICSQFHSYSGYVVLGKVLTSNNFRLGKRAFAELTNAVCSYKNYFVGDIEELHLKTDVYICNPQIITNLLLPLWQHWEKSDSSLMITLFRGLHSLILGTNSYKQLNMEQLISVNIIEKTLDMCKEKFVLEEKSENVNRDLCSAILGFIKTMIGTPPSSNHVKSIIDYLYVVHPTSHSFCTHSANGFYFQFSALSKAQFKKWAANGGAVAENFNMDDDDTETTSHRSAATTRETRHGKQNAPYNRGLSKSLVNLQEKRESGGEFLKSVSTHSHQSEDEEYKDKATDSGIAESHSEEQVNDLCSFGSLPQLTEMDGEYGVSYFVSEMKNPQTQHCSSQFYKYISPHCSNNALPNMLESNNYKDECNQYIISTGLLNLIHDTILVLPDSLIGNIFKNIIDYKLFLIMANHPNVTVRNAVVKTLLAWLVRCDEEETVKFVMQMKGFYHLANQLSMHSANEELVNSCISLMARCHWDALDQVDDMEDLTLPSLHFSALPPLLAIFSGTLHDLNLALSVVRFFRLLINKVPQALKKLIDNGLVESLVKTILVLIHSDVDGRTIEGSSVLLNDIIDLLAVIMTTCVQTPGVLYLQIMNEIVYKCRYLEVTEEARCGVNRECVQIIHNLHCSVLKAGLDTILSLIDIYHSQDFLKGRRSPSFLTSMTGTMSASLSSIPSSIMSFASSSGNKKHLPRSELIDRYKLLINRATEYLQFSSSTVVTDKDMKFACHLFSTLMNGVSNIVHNKPYIRIGSPWSSIYWSARETLRTQASHLLIWMLVPSRPDHLRMYAIEALLNEPRAKDIISTLVFINVETEQRFIIFLWHLMFSANSHLTQSEMQTCEEFRTCLQEWEIVTSQSLGHAHDRWQFDVTTAIRELSVLYWALEKGQQDAVYKCVYKLDPLSKKVTETAISISAAVSERQGRERKKLLNSMRDKYRLHVEARTKWRQIVQQMTHERAPWFDPDTYPDCWELDPTEGPARVRKRLRRCRLGVDKKFLKPEFADKMKDNHATPLAYLFENNDIQSMYTVALDSLSMDDTISYMCYATNVQPTCEVDGELLIGAKNLYFIATRISEKNVTITETDQFSLIVKFDQIKEIHNRRFQLKERAIEIFLLNGKTYLIAFNSQSERDNFIAALSECSLPNRIVSDMLLSDAVDKWKEGHILNWEYLKTLNKMAGRSYNDLMQYPIMPFILADYKSDTIDIRDHRIYRNLKKPMAVQDKKKELYFVNHYNYLKNESTTSHNIASLKQQPYHYASHYSNSGTVLHFLLRLPPYTQIFLQYQDNNFDLPDRTFHSLDTTWRLTSSESTTDVKELIPEFFYLPEFLINLEGFNFGVRQNGEMVDNVKLPSWANGDARLFVLVHRQILESEFVRENLPHWIDLVFGFKQTGKEAVDAINVFHPATYYGFDVDSIPDSLERAAWETMVKTYGQTPRQLFRTPHPMVVQNLMPEDRDRMPVVKGVKGLKWGNYVGSPSQPAPTIVWNNFHSSPVALLVPLITNDVFGLPEQTSLLLSYNKERSVNLVNEGVTLLGAALLSWGHLDGIVRIKERKEQPQIPFIFCPPKDPISVCSTTPDCPYIWIGLSSGNILVFRYTFNSESGGVDVDSEPITLLGHKKKVNSIYLSHAFGIAVTASEDEHIIIWDLNELVYIRSTPSDDLPVKLVAVSDTLGDIASVCYEEKKDCILRLHTINATLVNIVTVSEPITALCFSTAPEGVSVNVIATGHSNGMIRLWSTWDLLPVGEIVIDSTNQPIIGITYSYDSQHLYASVSDGNVFIWETANSSGSIKTPKFLNLTTVNYSH